MLGDIDKKEKTDLVISLLNDIVLVGMDTLLLHDIYHTMTSFKFLTPLAYEESVSIGEEMQRLFSGTRVDVANLHLPEVTVFHIGKWAVITKRFSIAKQIIRYVEHSLARVEQEDATNPMRVARILYLLGFILPYPELWIDTALRHIRLNDLFHKLITKLRISSGMKVLNNQTAIVNSAFFSLRDLAFGEGVSMSLSQYILLSKLSRFNPFYHLQFNVALIASLRNKTEVPHAYKRYLSTIEQISRRHKPIRIIYYLWKFILEYEMENFDALIGTANAAYQWDRRNKQYYTNITLWLKRYSIKLHPFANRQTWENALNELEEIYIAEPFLVSIEEFCPLRRWLRQKGGIELPSNDDFLRRVERNARQLFHVPFLDTELTEKINLTIDNTLKSNKR
ncbi:MAG: hypothetical protein GXO48_09725 [Chlorobi bacterium]|nr:hypothetical protein [Chlorobiota bacterium]